MRLNLKLFHYVFMIILPTLFWMVLDANVVLKYNNHSNDIVH